MTDLLFPVRVTSIEEVAETVSMSTGTMFGVVNIRHIVTLSNPQNVFRMEVSAAVRNGLTIGQEFTFRLDGK